MPSVHSIRAVLAATALALSAAHGASAQLVPVPPPLPETNGTTFTIFFNGRPLGSEQIAVNRVADGWMITSSGRLGAPVDAVSRRLVIRYTSDWHPISFEFDGTIRGQTQAIRTIVDGTTANSEITIGTEKTQRTDTIDPAALLVLTNSFFAGYEAIAARAKGAAAGTEIPIYAEGPMFTVRARLGDSTGEQIQTVARLVAAHRTPLTLQMPLGEVEAVIWWDDAGRLVRFSLPGQQLEVAREDIAAVSSRTVRVSRANDEAVTIPSNGFNLAGTLSRPATSDAPRLPAVVLVSGSGAADRDGFVSGVPILGQIAGALADGGFIVLRYDKRGAGQSGGRAEAATLNDYAEDARAAVKFLEARKDVDSKRLAIVGHSEGGIVALIAASKDKRIDAAALLATPGMAGSDLILAQQKHLLDRMKISPEERQAKIDTQKQINDAVASGKGIDQLPADVRRTIDNAEFRSLLASDPEKLMKDVRQPLLIVQGELDTQVEPKNADLLAALAAHRKKAPPAEVVKVPGVNHLLATATTGEVDEYASLKDKQVAAPVTQAIVSWLKKTLSTAR
jgi:uncharacterized protein